MYVQENHAHHGIVVDTLVAHCWEEWADQGGVNGR